MSASLVGSEMCIRDRHFPSNGRPPPQPRNCQGPIATRSTSRVQLGRQRAAILTAMPPEFPATTPTAT
eukprot:3117683-Alexandrium_andersonii.AAC.1